MGDSERKGQGMAKSLNQRHALFTAMNRHSQRHCNFKVFFEVRNRKNL